MPTTSGNSKDKNGSNTTTLISVRASLCDSRSCHHNRGGEHMKPDIEDLLSLVPGGGRATLTTCMGMCNRGPNMILRSRKPVVLYKSARPGRLVNDGGLRMRMEEDEEDDDGDIVDQEETTTKVILNETTIQKAAWALGVLKQHPRAVRAIECKSAGNKCLQAGNYKDALHHYLLGRSTFEPIVEDQSDINTNSVNMSISSLAASLWLCCVRCRVQWATKTSTSTNKEPQQHVVVNAEEKMQLLQLAARDAVRVLDTNFTRDELDEPGFETTTSINSVIARLIQTEAKIVQTKTPPPMMAHDQEADISSCRHVPVTTDSKILAHLCVGLADAWSGLAAAAENSAERASFAQGALVAYRDILNLTGCGKVFRARERRRIETMVATTLELTE